MVFGHSPRNFIQTEIYQREIKLPYHNFDIDNIFKVSCLDLICEFHKN